MKEQTVDYLQFLNLVDTKALLLQYADAGDRYNLFAVEGNVSWNSTVLKGTSEETDFVSNRKTAANKPLEYRSTDGLPKIASALFSDLKSFWADGTATQADLAAGETKYVKTHFSTEFTLSGVDANWSTANWGDYVSFEVGFYIDPLTESTWQLIQKFADQYKIYGTGGRTFEVPAVKVIPSTVNISGTNYDVYIRATCANTGSSPSKVVINLIGWK